MKKVMWIMVSLIWLLACKNDRNSNQTSNTTPDRPVISVIAPEFNADSAYYFVEKQVDFGPRVPNTPAHRQCGDYLINTLKIYGAEVTVQEFVAEAYNGTKLHSRNIIASYFPQATKRILLAAHWDTRHVADKDAVDQNKPIDGANDGGSGVGILLEIARVLQADTLKPNVGIDIIFFDAEDYGEPENAKPEELPNKGNNKVYWCLGSQYWAANKHKPNYSAYYGILLDMVGAKGSTFAKEGTSMENAPSVVEKVWNIANALGHGGMFINQTSTGITDDHVFVNRIAKINMIDIIDYDSAGDDYFGSYHHTHADNMLIIDKTTLKAVGQTVLQTLYEEGNANEAI
ncbi:M28 family peptidase [Rhodocytophaga rosea]|uniref:M28 family peptidase n=1 Tax=Rhodocytophaga rosea TaxID=2704465 RepID=A0A6C0GGD3_9BACT|nr:M28 family peptidase [Rhodocytophaga rosea]QHT67017.1 M28 family peptidase [Rhodocytophaga rosea]